MKKAKIKLDNLERRIPAKLLYEKRNELIREGRCTDKVNAPGEDLSSHRGRFFVFLSDLLIALPQSGGLRYPGCFIRTGLGAGSLNKRFAPYGYQ